MRRPVFHPDRPPGRKPKLGPEARAAIINDLRPEAVVAREHGVHQTTVHRIRRKATQPTRRNP